MVVQLVRLPRVTRTVDSAPSRDMRACTWSPGLCAARTDCSAATDGTGWPARAVMMSPGWIPALAVAPSGLTPSDADPGGLAGGVGDGLRGDAE